MGSSGCVPCGRCYSESVSSRWSSPLLLLLLLHRLAASLPVHREEIEPNGWTSVSNPTKSKIATAIGDKLS